MSFHAEAERDGRKPQGVGVCVYVRGFSLLSVTRQSWSLFSAEKIAFSSLQFELSHTTLLFIVDDNTILMELPKEVIFCNHVFYLTFAKGK